VSPIEIFGKQLIGLSLMTQQRELLDGGVPSPYASHRVQRSK
jgi:hypothetical protein